LLLHLHFILQADQVGVQGVHARNRADHLLLQHRGGDLFVRLRDRDIAGVICAAGIAEQGLRNQRICIGVREGDG
jgi:hypothetical protein